MEKQKFIIKNLNGTIGGFCNETDDRFAGEILCDAQEYEEYEMISFKGTGDYAVRLQRYLECPEDFALGICTTKTFSHYLRRFIRSFKPEKLLPGKNLWLHLEKNGCFTVRLEKMRGRITCLSEAEELIFRYLCFLHLRRFWDNVRRQSRFPTMKFPVVIWDFSGRLDESVDYSALLQRARETADQIFVIEE